MDLSFDDQKKLEEFLKGAHLEENKNVMQAQLVDNNNRTSYQNNQMDYQNVNQQNDINLMLNPESNLQVSPMFNQNMIPNNNIAKSNMPWTNQNYNPGFQMQNGNMMGNQTNMNQQQQNFGQNMNYQNQQTGNTMNSQINQNYNPNQYGQPGNNGQFGNQFVNNSFQQNNSMMGTQNQMNMNQQQMNMMLNGNIAQNSTNLQMNQNYNKNMNQMMGNNMQVNNQGMSMSKIQNNKPNINPQQFYQNPNWNFQMNQLNRNQNQQFNQQVQINKQGFMSYQMDKQVSRLNQIESIRESLKLVVDHMNVNSTNDNFPEVVVNMANLASELKRVVESSHLDSFKKVSNYMEVALHDVCVNEFKSLEDIILLHCTDELVVRQDKESKNKFKSSLEDVVKTLDGCLQSEGIQINQMPSQQQSTNQNLNSINMINDSSKNNIQNYNKMLEKSDKEKVLDLIEAHELVSKMIALSRVSKSGLFDHRTIADFMYGRKDKKGKKISDGCKDLLSKMNENNCLKEELSRLIEETISPSVYGNFDKSLHDFKITVGNEKIKFELFARNQLENFLKNIESELNNLTERGTKDLGLWKDNENKLKKIVESAQKQNSDRNNLFGSSNLDNTNNLGFKSKTKSLFNFFKKGE